MIAPLRRASQTGPEPEAAPPNWFFAVAMSCSEAGKLRPGLTLFSVLFSFSSERQEGILTCRRFSLAFRVVGLTLRRLAAFLWFQLARSSASRIRLRSNSSTSSLREPFWDCGGIPSSRPEIESRISRGSKIRSDACAGPGEYHCTFDGVLQFPDVSGPVVVHQDPERVLVDGFHRLPVLAAEAGQEVVGQQRDVILPVAQRRHVQSDDLEAVVEVLSEPAFPDRQLQVHVGGGHDSHVDLGVPHAAHGTEFPFLQNPQQLGLGLHRNGIDLVQENRAPMGDLEQPLLGGRGGR